MSYAVPLKSAPQSDHDGPRNHDVPKPIEAPHGHGRFHVARHDDDHDYGFRHTQAPQPAGHHPYDGPQHHGPSGWASEWCHAQAPQPASHHSYDGPQHHGPSAWASEWGDVGHLQQLLGPYGAGSPTLVIPIEHLEINNNTLIQNHLTENTNVIFNAADGGSVDVGGNVNALSFGTSQIVVDQVQQFGGSCAAAELGWGENAWGEAGGFEAVLFGHLPAEALPAGYGPSPLVIIPIEHLEINNNTIVQNTQVENTNILFNASHGGDIGVGGDVNALSSQQSLIALEQPSFDPSLLG